MNRGLLIVSFVIIVSGAFFTIVSLTQQMCSTQIRFQNGTVIGGCGYYIDYRGLAIAVPILVIGLLLLVGGITNTSRRNAKSLVTSR